MGRSGDSSGILDAAGAGRRGEVAHPDQVRFLAALYRHERRTTMPEFAYHFTQTAGHTVFVDAPTREAGEPEAWDRLPVSLCHACAHEYEMSGDWIPDDKADSESDAEDAR
jgi:hypothetical protein